MKNGAIRSSDSMGKVGRHGSGGAGNGRVYCVPQRQRCFATEELGSALSQLVVQVFCFFSWGDHYVNLLLRISSENLLQMSGVHGRYLC